MGNNSGPPCTAVPLPSKKRWPLFRLANFLVRLHRRKRNFQSATSSFDVKRRNLKVAARFRCYFGGLPRIKRANKWGRTTPDGISIFPSFGHRCCSPVAVVEKSERGNIGPTVWSVLKWVWGFVWTSEIMVFSCFD